MHYYQFNIGDYLSHTRHLTPIEDICYRRALDYYYLHEQPLVLNIPYLARVLMLSEYESQLELVLFEFFERTDSGFINSRADKEIAQYREFSEAGKRGAAKRWQKGSDSPPNSPPKQPPIANTNHKPLTTNYKPIVKTLLSKSDDFDEFWKAYPKKVGKDAARKAWEKVNPRLDDVMHALSWQVQSPQWFKNSGQYIPNPSTYINQGRWQDEPTQTIGF